MAKTVIIIVLILLICAVIYDFIKSSNRNKEKFGSDFFLDSIKKGSTTKDYHIDTQNSSSYSTPVGEKEKTRFSANKIVDIKCGNRKIAECEYGNFEHKRKR